MDTNGLGRGTLLGVTSCLQGWRGLIRVTPKSLRIVWTEREAEEAERSLGEKT